MSLDLLREFRRRQQAMYAGADLEVVTQMLAENVVWHVPGTSPIAGDHRGRDAVLAYFRLRRELAGATMLMEPREALEDRDTVVEFTDGSAEIGGRRVSWRTVGVYRFAGEQLVEVWLVPLDLDAFDAIWSSARPTPDPSAG